MVYNYELVDQIRGINGLEFFVLKCHFNLYPPILACSAEVEPTG